MLLPLVVSSALAAQAVRHFLLPQYAITTIVLPILSVTLFSYYFIWRIFLWPNFFSPIRRVPGPKGHWFYGNFREIFREDPGEPHLRWMTEHPNEPIIRYTALFASERLMIASPKAHQYIMTNCYAYPKPADVSGALKTILGAEGILFAEGDVHRRQRKQMNPSFSYANLKAMVPIFWSKSQELVGYWSDVISKNSKSGSTASAEIEVLNALSAATLDIIGSAGFGTEFGSIRGLAGGQQNPLAAAYADMFDFSKASRILSVAAFYQPWVRSLPFKRHRELDADIETVSRVANEIISDKVARLDRGEDTGDDIFSLLLRDNNSKKQKDNDGDAPLTHKEIADQSLTLLAAGHETTSSSTTWAMHALSIHQDVQKKLRLELTENIGHEEPTFEQLDSLKYLGNVVKEVLRFFPPVPITRRTAIEDGYIEGVFVPKDSNIFIVPSAINRSPLVWGSTANTFDPDRWDNLPLTYNHYGNETFLHGSRGCIGQRFAIMEMKCLLTSIVTAFQIDPKPNHKVEPKSNITMRPKGGLPVILTQL
ncbi:hypothetical protein PYCC9005_003650 [Savitreella phatthalungensis]